VNLYSTLSCSRLHFESTQIWTVYNNGTTLFYLPPTHEPYLPLLPSRRASLLFTHCAYPKRDGQAELAWVAGYILRKMSCTRNWIWTWSHIHALTGPDPYSSDSWPANVIKAKTPRCRKGERSHAGLLFPVAQIHYLPHKHNHTERAGAGVLVYLAATMEYLAAM